MLQITRSTEAFDAVVVGSGATGGWAAKKLTEAGLTVALLEAGKKISVRDFTEHVPSWKMPYMGFSPEIRKRRPIQGLCYACRETNQEWFVDDIENPYTQDKPFHWIRMRVLGGRSMSWGRQSYRMGDLDFKAKSHDGYGDDWPINHEDLRPYYEEVERYVGISGTAENLPQLPDSVFLPGMAMTCSEEVMKTALARKMGRAMTIGRVAILTKSQNGRAACHYCGPCEQGCSTLSYFNSPTTTIKDAAATSKLTLMTDAVCSHVTMKDGKASGVAYIDAVTKQAREVRGKTVILCASTLESTRLLMNSKICGNNDALGKYVMDHIYQGGAAGVMPGLEARPWAGPPRRPNGIYIPRFRNVKESSTNGMIRGYGYQGSSEPRFTMNRPGFGATYKEQLRQGEWGVGITAWAECLARKENYVALEQDKRDEWGIPILRIHADWSDNEKALFRDAQLEGARMLEAAGAKNVAITGQPSVPGFCIHETGTARMGNDPNTSVFNKYAQAHEVDNLFCTDGAVWVSSGCQNPTLTMMAITVRTCDYILKGWKQG